MLGIPDTYRHRRHSSSRENIQQPYVQLLGMGRHRDARMGRRLIRSVHLHAVLENGGMAGPHCIFGTGYSPSVPTQPLSSTLLLVTPTANGDVVVPVVGLLFCLPLAREEAVGPVTWW